MKEFKTYVKIFKILIMVGWFFSTMFLTIGVMLHFGNESFNPQSSSLMGLLSIIFLGVLTMMTPIFFYSVFGKVWMNGIESLEKERLKMIEETDKYTESRMNVNKWLEKQIKKDLEKDN